MLSPWSLPTGDVTPTPSIKNPSVPAAHSLSTPRLRRNYLKFMSLDYTSKAVA